MSKVLTQIYASERKPGYYLYVPKETDLKEVPEPLLKPLGKLRKSLLLLLTPEKALANADVNTVIEALKTKGFYLQFPPAEDPMDNWGKQ